MPSKPIYSPSDEQELMTQLWSPAIRDDPEAFVMFAYPWGVKNTPLEHKAGPRKWQRKVLRRIAAHIAQNKTKAVLSLTPEMLRLARVSGRGIGKSALVCWLIDWMLTTRIGSSVNVSANTESQLRKVTWAELTKWIAMSINVHWWDMTATSMKPHTWLSSLVERDLKKGTRYWGAEGKLWSEENPDGYAGAHNPDGMMVIFDEASGIPDSIWPVAAGFFTEPVPDRYWFAFSNGRRNSGYFFECFHAKRDFWDNDSIDARTVEDTDPKIYQEIIDEYGEDSDPARVEVYGQFPKHADGQFIGPMLVDAAAAREPWFDKTAPIVVGVDPARGGSDSTVIAVRRGRDIVKLLRYHGDDTMQTVGHVIDVIREFRPVLTVVDEGGLGYGVLDRLKEQNYKVRGVNFGWRSKQPVMWGNKRAEMWGEMRKWLETASIPDDKQLKADLTGPKGKPDSAGTIFLESKKEMKARGLSSPDAADAIAVTFAFPVNDDPTSPAFLGHGSAQHALVLPTLHHWSA
jgi:hypothetical protein